MNNIIVLDIEATCSDDSRWKRHNHSEIISIGVVEIEMSNLRIIPRENILVKPEKTKITDYCTMITGLTQEELDEKGIPFEHVCLRLKTKYNTHKKTWASFGTKDKKLLRAQCFANNIDYPMNGQYYDIQNLTALLLGMREERSLCESLELFDMKFEGIVHNGLDDAKNAARILVKLLQGNLPTKYKGL